MGLKGVKKERGLTLDQKKILLFKLQLEICKNMLEYSANHTNSFSCDLFFFSKSDK